MGEVSVVSEAVFATCVILVFPSFWGVSQQIWEPVISSGLGVRGRKTILHRRSHADTKVGGRKQFLAFLTQSGTRTRTRRRVSLNASENTNRSKTECYTEIYLVQRWRKRPFERQIPLR